MENQNHHVPISNLVWQATQFISEQGYSASSLYHYNRIWRHLLDYANQKNQDHFTLGLGLDFLKEAKGISSPELLTKGERAKLRPIKVLHDIMYGNIPSRKYMAVPIYIPQQFRNAYGDYQSYLFQKGQRARTVETKVSRIKVFFEYLDNCETNKLYDLSFKDIIGFYRFLREKYAPNAISNIQFTLRDFLRYAEDSGITKQGCASYIQRVHCNNDERLPSFYTPEETNRILQAVDRTCAEGKRDYAILLIAIRLGIRSIDICRLSIPNIQWNDDTIVFCQSKTGNYQKLPMTEEIKYVLADYLKNGRPHTNNDTLFVRCFAPYDAFSTGSSLYRILNKYMDASAINTEGKHHGMHSMRHSLSSSLLSAGTPLPIITGILGHSSTKTTTRYLWMDTEQLRMVALEVPYERE